MYAELDNLDAYIKSLNTPVSTWPSANRAPQYDDCSALESLDHVGDDTYFDPKEFVMVFVEDGKAYTRRLNWCDAGWFHINNMYWLEDCEEDGDFLVRPEVLERIEEGAA